MLTRKPRTILLAARSWSSPIAPASTRVASADRVSRPVNDPELERGERDAGLVGGDSSAASNFSMVSFVLLVDPMCTAPPRCIKMGNADLLYSTGESWHLRRMQCGVASEYFPLVAEQSTQGGVTALHFLERNAVAHRSRFCRGKTVESYKINIPRIPNGKTDQSLQTSDGLI
jgi:hypothetical protein